MKTGEVTMHVPHLVYIISVLLLPNKYILTVISFLAAFLKMMDV